MSVGRSLGICVQCFIYTRVFLFHACILMMFRVFFQGYFLAVGHVKNQDNKCLGIVEAEFEI